MNSLHLIGIMKKSVAIGTFVFVLLIGISYKASAANCSLEDQSCHIALMKACRFVPEKIRGNQPFISGELRSAWRWDSANPYREMEVSFRSKINEPIVYPSCEKELLSGLLADGGTPAIYNRCKSYQYELAELELNFREGRNLSSSESHEMGKTEEKYCTNPSANRAEFACAFVEHQRDFDDAQKQLSALQFVRSMCQRRGVTVPDYKDLSRRQRETGVDPYNHAYCGGGGGGNTYILPPKKHWLETIGDIAINGAAIWSLSNANKMQNDNALAAIHYNYKLGLGSLVTAGPQGYGMAGGGYGVGWGGGIGVGGIAGSGGMCGAGGPYQSGYSACGYAAGGFGGVPGPYGTNNGNYGYGGASGYPYFGGGAAGANGGLPGPYGTKNSPNGYPWGGAYGGGTPYYGGYGGAGTYAQGVLKDMQRMQHAATQMQQQEKQLQSIQSDMQKLQERYYQTDRTYASTANQFYSSAGQYGYGGGGYGAGYGSGAGYYGGGGGYYGGGQNYCLLSPCGGGGGGYGYAPYNGISGGFGFSIQGGN